MRIAIIHDWLATFTGAERVLEQLLILYPAADVFTLVDHLPDKDRSFLGGLKIETSWLQKAPFSRKHFRKYLPLMPFLIEQLDVSKYDLVISSSWAFAKGVLVGADQPHVSYVHTPVRYASQLKHQYLEQAGLTRGLGSLYVRRVLHQLRQWDATTMSSVDAPIANSRYIARRILKSYRREAQVIYPPVDVDQFPPCFTKQDYYVAVSRLVPYKRFDLLIAAFNKMPQRRLVIVGSGPENDKLRAMAGPNIEMAGFLAHEDMVMHMRQAKAFLMAAEEDFGIVVGEAQACGTPVISYSRGGAPEIIRTDPSGELTGLLFEEQSVEAVIDAVDRFEHLSHDISPAVCAANAQRFAPARFRQEFGAVVDRVLAEYGSTGRLTSLDGAPEVSTAI